MIEFSFIFLPLYLNKGFIRVTVKSSSTAINHPFEDPQKRLLPNFNYKPSKLSFMTLNSLHIPFLLVGIKSTGGERSQLDILVNCFLNSLLHDTMTCKQDLLANSQLERLISVKLKSKRL